MMNRNTTKCNEFVLGQLKAEAQGQELQWKTVFLVTNKESRKFK